MALLNTDLFLVQDSSNNSLYKTTMQAISQFVQTDDIGVVYRGKANFTAAVTGQLNPATPEGGDFYVNDTAGIADSSWATIAGEVAVGDFAIYNSTNNNWDYIPNQSDPGGQVDAITATLPLEVDTTSIGSDLSPHLTVNEASVSQSGVVNRLAFAADVAATNNTPDFRAVVTADLLNATNKLVAQNAAAIEEGGGGSGGGGGGATELNDLTDVDTSGVTDGMVVAYEQATGIWKPVTPAALTVDVDLGYTPAATQGTITNNAGDNAVIPAATISAAGLVTASDKQKLDGIEAGADVTPDLTNYLQKGDNISELVNDVGYITSSGGGGGSGGGGTGNAVQLNDNGVRQSIVGGGGLDVMGGISTQFGTSTTQLGNVAPLNDWSSYPARI